MCRSSPEGRTPTARSVHQPFLTEVGGAHGKFGAPLVLRWLTQRSVVVIPKSVRPERMAQNLAVFDFTVTDEMTRITALDTGASLSFDHRDHADGHLARRTPCRLTIHQHGPRGAHEVWFITTGGRRSAAGHGNIADRGTNLRNERMTNAEVSHRNSQVSNAAPSSRRTMVREDSAPVAGCGPTGFGWIVMRFVVVDPDASVVLPSL